VLERAWPLGRVPQGLELAMTDGDLRVNELTAAGVREAFAGLQGVSLSVGRDAGNGEVLRVSANPFDARGRWGAIGADWTRDPATQNHRLALRLDGAGFAQLVGSRLAGLSVGDAADVGLLLDARFDSPDRVVIDGRVALDHMGLAWWRLADRPIDDFALSTSFRLTGRRAPASLHFATPDLRLGEARMAASADIHQIDRGARVSLRLAAPPQDCGAMLHAIPQSMLPSIGTIDAHGQMSWLVGLDVALASVGAVNLTLELEDRTCTVDRFGRIDLSEMLGKWDRPVNENGRILEDVRIGPGSDAWAPIERLPYWVTYAIWSSEDSFYKHRGISEKLLEKALGIDLWNGRFIYGGSTITQQLVKNLYLTRKKNLARKFEEMLIVWHMERFLGKKRILEAYVNGVEFGPKLYGIRRASNACFSKEPWLMTPTEALFLALIKPSPRNGFGYCYSGGWNEWFTTKMKKYMDKFLAEGAITQAQYDEDAPSFKPKFNPGGKTPESGKKRARVRAQ